VGRHGGSVGPGVRHRALFLGARVMSMGSGVNRAGGCDAVRADRCG
jgi:hypothetical protein